HDVFGTLAVGGAIVIPTAEATRDPAAWSQLMDRYGVTIWNSVPALLRTWLDHCERFGAPATLRLALLSGDWISVGLPDRLRAMVRRCRVVSLGGATEASIWSILYPVETVDPEWTSIPYGRPMKNQRFYVLDDRLVPRPDWVTGDLYIGGVGLAQGYLND